MATVHLRAPLTSSHHRRLNHRHPLTAPNYVSFPTTHHRCPRLISLVSSSALRRPFPTPRRSSSSDMAQSVAETEAEDEDSDPGWTDALLRRFKTWVDPDAATNESLEKLKEMDEKFGKFVEEFKKSIEELGGTLSSIKKRLDRIIEKLEQLEKAGYKFNGDPISPKKGN